MPERPCPWCGGELTLRTDPDEAPEVTCSTGEDCAAPVPLDVRGRRMWGWGDVVVLADALAQQVPAT